MCHGIILTKKKEAIMRLRNNVALHGTVQAINLGGLNSKMTAKDHCSHSFHFVRDGLSLDIQLKLTTKHV